jgi:hypothetical protein
MTEVSPYGNQFFVWDSNWGTPKYNVGTPRVSQKCVQVFQCNARKKKALKKSKSLVQADIQDGLTEIACRRN